MTEPLTPPTDPFEPPASQPAETPTAPVPPATEQPPAAPQPPAYPGYGQPAQPDYAQPSQPAYGQPAYGQQPAQPAYGQPYQPYQPYPAGQAPVSGMPVSGMPTSGYPAAGYPTSGFPAAGYPAIDPTTGLPMQPPVKKKSKATKIIAIVLGVVLLLCGGGAVAAVLYFKNSVDPLGTGSPDPKAATVAFLEAYYKDKDADAAAKATCKELRDPKVIGDRITKIEDQLKNYRSPKVTWTDPTIESTGENTAVATVKLSLSTGDEKSSSIDLKITLVKNDGWRGCDVS
jgi:hypothetical protein